MGPSTGRARRRVVAQGGEESRGLPLALRDLLDEPLSPRCPAAQAGPIVLRPGFIDEDEAPGIDDSLIGAPARAMAANVRAILLALDEGSLWNGPPLLPAS
jgi:hypothetical protein